MYISCTLAASRKKLKKQASTVVGISACPCYNGWLKSSTFQEEIEVALVHQILSILIFCNQTVNTTKHVGKRGI